MSYKSRSVLLIATCIFAISKITLAADFACAIPRNFTVKISDQVIAIISEAELSVQVRENLLTVSAYPGTNSLEIQAYPVIISFSGYLKIQNENRTIAFEPERISEIYHDRLSGTTRKATTSNPIDSTTDDCRVVLLPVGLSSSRVHLSIASKIRRLAESCVEREICSEIDSVRFENERNSSSGWERNFSSANNSSPCTFTVIPMGKTNKGNDDIPRDNMALQKAINTIVDISIGQLVAKLANNNEGTIILPSVDKKFSFGSGILKTTAHLELFNGTFRDLRTLHRRSDAFISHTGDIFIAAIEVGLEKVDVTYSNYKLKYGIRASGKLSGTVSNVAIAARVSADYDQKTCVTKLDELRVTQFGIIHFGMTGLGGPLNSLVSTLTESITVMLKKNIVIAIEKNVGNIIKSQLSRFDCEKFRSSILRS